MVKLGSELVEHDRQHDRLWAEEALRRNQEMEDGKVKGVPLEEVLAELRAE